MSTKITRQAYAEMFGPTTGDRLRLVDRQLMSGEWPPLLEVMGKEGADGRYLSLRELRVLFVERRLPTRMLKRLGRRPRD